MLHKASGKSIYRCEWLPVCLLFVLGCVLRLWALGDLPYGLNQDEASAGYEAWSLLHYGMDRCGKSYPVLLISWGSGQNALMSYLAMPFVALLGLSELSLRLPNAIAGCLTLPLFWLLARRARGVKFGLCALLLLAVNPWHIMASRWALESNLFPLFLLCGIYFASLAEDRPWALIFAAASLALSVYAYGTAFFFLPFFLIFAVIFLRRSLRPAPFFVSLALFILLVLPITVCQTANLFGWDEISVFGMTLPKLTQSRQTATSVFGGGGFSAAMDNFRSFLHILLSGSDGLIYNALPLWKGGVFYFFGLPTAFLGFVSSLLCRRDRREEGVIRMALYAALICTFLIRCNINRINMVWLPLIYFSALGCHLILEKLGKWAALPLLGILLCCGIFCQNYKDTFSENINYYPGLGEAISYAETLSPETTYITDFVNQPYIFALFYSPSAPQDFLATVEYRDESAAFRQVKRFGNYEFERPETADVLILPDWQTEGYEVLERFGAFAVCQKERP